MFDQILRELVESIPGAIGAIVADWEGESVAFFTTGDDYELKVIAAHKGIIMSRLRRIHDQLELGEMKEAVLTGETVQIVTGAVTRDYSLVLVRHPIVPSAIVLRKFRQAVARLHEEIG